MSIRPIIVVPNPILKQVSSPCTAFDASLAQIIDDLHDSMAASERPGAGLAAVQIGILKRVLIANVASDSYGSGIVEMVNPVILESSGKQVFEEGCLSIPEEYDVEVERASMVSIRYYNRHGEQFTESFTELCATVVQHELDHLDGKLILDYVSKLRRDMILRKISKNSRK